MYALEQAFRAIKANWIATVSTVTTMTLSLTILAAFSLLSVNLNAALSAMQNELEIAAYLVKHVERNSLVEQTSAWPEVESVTFVTADEALQTMLGELPSLAQAAALVQNPLPPTLHVKLYHPVDSPTIRARLEGLAVVTGVDDSSEAESLFLALNDALRIGGLILVVVLLVATFVAIVNAIRAAITARKKEIDVMRLVGASHAFIRAPFLIEGFLLGLVSAVFALALVIPGYSAIISRLAVEFTFVPFVRDMWLIVQITGLLGVLSVLIGLGGSAVSVTQFLREEY